MRKRYLLMLLVIAFISISCASASDFDNATVGNVTTDSIRLDQNTIGTFDELNDDFSHLSPGDVYDINKDYIFEPPWGSNGPKLIMGDYGVDINVDNVTINGNGHCLDGNYKTNILKVTGNNVKIFNLNFINSKYSGFDIPIRGENDNNVIAAGITRTILKVFYTTDQQAVMVWPN